MAESGFMLDLQLCINVFLGIESDKKIDSRANLRLLQNSIVVILRESAGSILVDKPFIDSAVKPSASPRGEPQNDKFKAFRNSLNKDGYVDTMDIMQIINVFLGSS
ncbi:MAG: hypothetical protein ABIH18_02590 [Candidatus Omnitrophota bacterium]